MRLELSPEDAATLRAFLRDALPNLRREVAATEGFHLKHEMVRRQEVVEQVLEQLGEQVEA